MILPRKTEVSFDPHAKVIPPGPGQTGHYLCRACGEHFIHAIPWFFTFGVRCPKCGSHRVGKDFMVQ